MTETFEAGHGIIEVEGRLLSKGAEREVKQWHSYFPDPDWLADQLRRAIDAEPDKLFVEYKDWGWFMERMSTYRAFLQSAVEANRIEEAVMYAAEVAALFAEARLKFKWERFALAGERSNRGASEGGRRRGTSDKINDRRGPLINCYLQKRAEKWEHDTACRYASEHAHQGSEFEAYSLKQAKRILERYK